MGVDVSAGSEGRAVIRTPDRRLRVFVSSTIGELGEERRAVARAVSAEVSPAVRDITGREPGDLVGFARDHAQQFM